MKIGIIGGSGLYSIEAFNYTGEEKIDTDYGEPSAAFKIYEYYGNRYYFLARHGAGHEFPPHLVNYRANISAFKKAGVDAILSFAAVGGISADLNPGDIVISDNAIDFTNGRNHTFATKGNIHHIDITEPFCPELRKAVKESCASSGLNFSDKGVYICTNGPRMETAAEIKAFKGMGADIVGMTLFPECSLAREAEICYVNISVVANDAAGISRNKLTADEVVETVKKSEDKLKRIILNLDINAVENRKCDCRNALENTRISKGK
ncbi:S-methyl-5'-thioinosine phosphorylase [Flexistipes sp.]|uniref:S-methyl-5'-thioinosine phosphorylase n=1 Tax=Flexistipes sp. TaxID=3088135 RepID=UPI002E1A88D6|nr:S-methyl-5'-thioinosine phosphorylase [Flexistipes sp.]